MAFTSVTRCANFSGAAVSECFGRPSSLALRGRRGVTGTLSRLNCEGGGLTEILTGKGDRFMKVVIPGLCLRCCSRVLARLLQDCSSCRCGFLIFIDSNNPRGRVRCLSRLVTCGVRKLVILDRALSSRGLTSCGVPIVTVRHRTRRVYDIAASGCVNNVRTASLLVHGRYSMLVRVGIRMPRGVPTCSHVHTFRRAYQRCRIPCRLGLGISNSSCRRLFRRVHIVFRSVSDGCSNRGGNVFLSGSACTGVFLGLVFRGCGYLPSRCRVVKFSGSPVTTRSVVPVAAVKRRVSIVTRAAVRLLIRRVGRVGGEGPTPLRGPVRGGVAPILVQQRAAKS